eukprot:4409261-Pyramimonas_sp.AAC.2
MGNGYEHRQTMANHCLLLSPFERRRCAGHRPRASARNRDRSMAAHYTSQIQSPFVDAVQIARDLFK